MGLKRASPPIGINWLARGTQTPPFWGMIPIGSSFVIGSKTPPLQQLDNFSYELMNEPWAGDIWHDPELLVPGVADIRNLAPMYENLNKAIRAADDQVIIIT